MTTAKDELQILAAAEALIEDADAMQSKYKPRTTADENFIFILLNKIQFFNNFLRRIYGSSAAITHLTQRDGETPVSILNAVKGTPIVGITLSVVNFFEIPLIYIAATVLNKKIPFTISNNAKWLYSSVLLALSIAAFAVPGVGAVLAVAAASIVLTVGLITLGKILYEYNQNKKILATNPVAQKERYVMQLLDARKNKKISLISVLIEEIERINLDLPIEEAEIQALYSEKYSLEKNIRIEAEALDTGVGIVLSTVAVVGTVISLFFTPVGSFILSVVALAGLAFAIGQIAAHYFSTAKKIPENQYQALNPDDPDKSTHNILESLSAQQQALNKSEPEYLDLKTKTVRQEKKTDPQEEPTVHPEKSNTPK